MSSFEFLHGFVQTIINHIVLSIYKFFVFVCYEACMTINRFIKYLFVIYYQDRIQDHFNGSDLKKVLELYF